MRTLTVAIIAAAALLVLVIAVSLQVESPTESQPAFRAPQTSRKPLARSERVEKRLGQLREDYDQRQLGGVNLAPTPRNLPPRSGDVPSAHTAEEVLLDLDDDEIEEFEELRDTILNDPDPDERMGAILMLTGAEEAYAIPVLKDAMNDPDSEVRLAAVEALGDFVEQLAPDVLLPALDDPDPEVRFEALGIVGDMETPEALALVRSSLDDPDEDVRALAEGILDFADEE